MLLPPDVGTDHDAQGRLPEHLAELQHPCQAVEVLPLAQAGSRVCTTEESEVERKE
jgi:hypothetical protein